MKSMLSIIGVAAGLSLASIANATVTYTFATTNEQVASGATYCSTYSSPSSCSSKQTVTVYGDQTNSSGTFVTPANAPYYDGGQSTESGLFTVTDSPNNFGTGIAPYNPNEGTSSGTFSSQDGLTDSVYGASSNNNILLLKLSDFAAGSTLSLLLQAGVTGDSFTVFTYDDSGAAPTSLGQMTKYDTSPINVDESGNNKPTNPQVTGLTIAGLSPSNTGWIAIEADCHYLLLDQLAVAAGTPGVPEPRFYGILLTGLLGLAGIAYQKRRSAQANS
jgi:hypothetical protein